MPCRKRRCPCSFTAMWPTAPTTPPVRAVATRDRSTSLLRSESWPGAHTRLGPVGSASTSNRRTGRTNSGTLARTTP
eukprot:27905-Eustigmatos_ZCMA.PRE.1